MMTTMRALFKSTASNGKGTGKANTNTTVASAAQTDNPNGMSTPPDEESPNTKQTQARRAQVRSAQIKHRQKKANHISELEGDVGKYRDLIAVTEKAAGELRMENEVIRRKLLAAGIVIDGLLGQRPQQDLQLQQQVQQHTPEDLTVTLAMSKVMGTPSLSVSSRSASTPDHWGLSPSQPGASPYSSHDDVWLTVAQEETAVNFILSLEHICWDHFHSEQSIDVARRVLRTLTHEGSGHTLMASTYCMASAPESVYKDRKSLPSTSKFSETPSSALSSSSSPASSSLHWSAPRISLQTLRGLASSLNPGDLELTPVQAWFELAERYPIALLLEGPGSALEALRGELRGLVKCLHYGAIIERQAFESVVTRIMDTALREMQQSFWI